MLYKILAGLVLALSVVCAALWFTASKRGADLEAANTLNRGLQTALDASLKVRRADTASGNARAVLSAATKKRKDNNDKHLRGAINRNPDWADVEVPADVVTSLGM